MATACGLLDGSFAPVTEKGMFDYATGKWAPAKFRNYVTGEWISGVPFERCTVAVGNHDSTLGRAMRRSHAKDGANRNRRMAEPIRR